MPPNNPPPPNKPPANSPPASSSAANLAKEQLPLALKWQSLSTFIKGKANSDALRLIQNWLEGNPSQIIVFGPCGCGKTHLLKTLPDVGALIASSPEPATEPKTQSASTDAPTPATKPTSEPAPKRLVLDNAATTARTNPQGLLHAINWAAQRHIPIALMARTPPANWQLTLEDLKSRLLVMAMAEIHQPDEELLKGLLAKLLADRSATTTPLVVEWLAKRMTRSYQSAMELVGRLDALALKDKSAITLSHAKQVLGGG